MMRRAAVVALPLFLVAHVHAATRNNDDSCDIATLPAATLLLPYFEVDLDDIGGETTLFTVTNVTVPFTETTYGTAVVGLAPNVNP